MIWDARGGCLQDLALVATRLHTAAQKPIAPGSSSSKRKHPALDAQDSVPEPAAKRKCLDKDAAPSGLPANSDNDSEVRALSEEKSPFQSGDKSPNVESDVGGTACGGSADKPAPTARPLHDETSYQRALLVLRHPNSQVDIVGCSLRGLPLRDLGLCTLMRVSEVVNVNVFYQGSHTLDLHSSTYVVHSC